METHAVTNHVCPIEIKRTVSVVEGIMWDIGFNAGSASWMEVKNVAFT